MVLLCSLERNFDVYDTFLTIKAPRECSRTHTYSTLNRKKNDEKDEEVGIKTTIKKCDDKKKKEK